MRVVALGILILSSATSCGGSPKPQPPPDERSPLVIPPLGADAGTPIVTTEPATTIGATPSATLAIAARDPRTLHRRPRSRALLTTEVQGLERLLAQTAPTAPDRPNIRRRIAENHSELAFTSSGPDAARSRQEAIHQYVGIKAESPNYVQIDEVNYYLGLAYELNGDLTSARKAYFDLIAKAPSSRFVPYAYFAFGEMFFQEAEADPAKNALAVQAYMEVLKHPPASTPLYAEALLRVGQTQLRMKEDAQAKQSFDRLRREFSTSDAATKIPSGY